MIESKMSTGVGGPGETSSDDIEEGEILDDEDTLKNISSLEEISDEELPAISPRPVAKGRKKKEHKCKAGSLCRRERPPKLCYARLSKKPREEAPPNYSDNRRPRSSNRLPHHSNGSDHYEKENRYGSRGRRSTSWRQPYGHFKGSNDTNRDFRRRRRLSDEVKSNHCHSSVTSIRERDGGRKKGAGHPPLNKPKPSDKDVPTIKVECQTSLFQRLMGSTQKKKSAKSNKESKTEHPLTPKDQPPSQKTQRRKEERLPSPKTATLEPRQTQEKSPPSSGPKDMDELQLRVTALRTAMLKKHLERKKRGITYRKNSKSQVEDDSFVEFLIDSDSNSIEKSPSLAGDVQHNNTDDDSMSICNDTLNTVIELGDNNKDQGFEELRRFEQVDQSHVYVNLSSYPPSVGGEVHIHSGGATTYMCPNYPAQFHSLPGTHYQPQYQGTASYLFTSPPPPPPPPLPPPKPEVPLPMPTTIPTPPSTEPPLLKFSLQTKAHKVTKNPLEEFEAKARKKRSKWDTPQEMVPKSPSHDDENGVGHSSPFESGDECDPEVLRELALSTVKKFSIRLKGSGGSSGSPKGVHGLGVSSEGGSPRVESSEEEIDEDILRAQLLSSLSSKFNDGHDSPADKEVSLPLPQESDSLLRHTKHLEKRDLFPLKARRGRKKIFLLNSQTKMFKRTSDKPLPVPKVEKLVITLGNSDSSENELEIAESPRKELNSKSHVDVEASVEELLKTVRTKHEAAKKANALVFPNSASNSASVVKEDLPSSLVSASTNCPGNQVRLTPLALKHLPMWQQEEYKRLKKQIAEKEKLIRLRKEALCDTPVTPPKRACSRGSDDDPLQRDREEAPLKKARLENSHENPLSSLDLHSPRGSRDLPSPSKGVVSEVNHSPSDEAVTLSSQESDNPRDKPSGSSSPPGQAVSEAEGDKSAAPIADSQSTSDTNHSNIQLFLLKKSLLVDEFDKILQLAINLESDRKRLTVFQKDILRLKRELCTAIEKMNLQKKIVFQSRHNLVLQRDVLLRRVKSFSSFVKSCQKVNPSEKLPNKDINLLRRKMEEVSQRIKKITSQLGQGEVDFKKEYNDLLKNKTQGNVSEEAKGEEAYHSNSQRGFLPSKSFSRTGEWDSMWTLCPYDVNGVCKDKECSFQHFAPQ